LFNFNGIPALEHSSKTGYMWILDRASGEPLVPYQEVAVPPTPADAAFQQPWPTQPVSSIESLTPHQATNLAPGQIAAQMWTTTGPTPLVFQPWAGGGTQWSPAAYSPRTGMIYSNASSSPANVGQTKLPCTTASSCTPKVIQTYCIPPSKIPESGWVFPLCGVMSGSPLLGVSDGVYGAVNTSTGKVAWSIPMLTTVPDSGMTVAGDLIFFGDSTGLFYAASAATGEILWVFDSWTEPNAGGGNASPAVYEINGVEYVGYGFGGAPGHSFALGDQVIAFALPSAVVAAAEKKVANGRKYEMK
jgi:glucose dehydrogenase